MASLLLALLMPFLGSIADLKGNKKRLLVGSIGTGAVLLACMGIPGNAMVFLVMYVVATIMLNASLVFYDAFLIDATDSEDRYDEVSSQGYAWGYIGSCVPFIICLVLVLFGEKFGLGQLDAIRISFVITAVWVGCFSVPVLKNVHQTHYKERTEHLFRDALVGLWATAKRIFADKRVFMFMLASFFYIDGVHTIITMSTSYGTDLGISSTQLVLALLVTQFVAFPSAIAYGRLAGNSARSACCSSRFSRTSASRCSRRFPALRHGILGACRVRRFVPGRHSGPFAQRVWQAYPEGTCQRVLRLLRYFRQVRNGAWHVARERVYPDYRQFFYRRPQHCCAVHRRLRSYDESSREVESASRARRVRLTKT